jgi:hypothetical protein
LTLAACSFRSLALEAWRLALRSPDTSTKKLFATQVFLVLAIANVFYSRIPATSTVLAFVVLQWCGTRGPWSDNRWSVGPCFRGRHIYHWSREPNDQVTRF